MDKSEQAKIDNQLYIQSILETYRFRVKNNIDNSLMVVDDFITYLRNAGLEIRVRNNE